MKPNKFINLFDKVDQSIIVNKYDFHKNASLPFDFENNYHICIYGRSRSGKSNFISRMLQHHYLHTIKPSNIWIMSPSFRTDDTYAPVRNFLRHELGKQFEEHIKRTPDLVLLNSLLESQLRKKLNNDDCQYMDIYGENPHEDQKMDMVDKFIKEANTMKYIDIEPVLVILDDCLGSDQMRAGSCGKLALFSTFSRHANIICVWVSQCFGRMPKVVREMCDMSVYFYCPVISDLLLSEWFNKEDRDKYRDFLKHNFGKG